MSIKKSKITHEMQTIVHCHDTASTGVAGASAGGTIEGDDTVGSVGLTAERVLLAAAKVAVFAFSGRPIVSGSHGRGPRLFSQFAMSIVCTSFSKMISAERRRGGMDKRVERREERVQEMIMQ